MWLEEAPFELKDFSPAVSSLRQEREAFSGVFKSNLFKDVGRIYISSQCRVARTVNWNYTESQFQSMRVKSNSQLDVFY